MLLDERRAALQRVVHHGDDGFGVELLAQCGGAHHVDEQDADLPEGSGGLGRRRGRGGERGELGALAGDGHIDDAIAEQGALRIQGGDPGFELLLLGRHWRAGQQCRGSLPCLP